MSKMKKLFAVLLTMIMALSMMVVGSAKVTGDVTKNAEVTISNLDKDATQVSFYKLIKTTVNADNSVTYELTDLAKKALSTKAEDGTVTEATVETITKDGADLQSIYAKVLNYVYNCNTDKDTTNNVTADATADVIEKSVTQQLELGCYAALVKTAGAVVYNPIIVSVNAQMSKVEGQEGKLGTATATNINAVAKYTPITENKDTTNGTTTPTQNGGSASVGDKVEFTLSATIPTYPADAQNKTLYMMDTLSKGLTLGTDDSAETASFTLHIGNDDKVLPQAAARVVEEVRNADGEKTFAVVFDYDELKKISGGATSMTVTYNVTVNTNAVVAEPGNKNTYKLVYANNPTQGGTYIPGDKPDGKTPNPINPGNDKDGITTSTEHTQTIYTYAFAIKKIDATTNAALKDAEFDVFAHVDAENSSKDIKVGTIKTDENGYGVLVGVEEGTYYIKERKAPEDYTLLDKTFVLTVNAENSQVYSTYTTEYKTNANIESYIEEKYMTTEEYKVYIAALKDEIKENEGTTSEGREGTISFTDTAPVEGRYYRNANGEIFEKQALVDADVMEEGATDAPEGYTAVNKYTVTTEKVTTVEMSSSSTVVNDETTNLKTGAYIAIPNTSLVELPSTGGIGTTIFTIAGVLVMIAAAAMFFVSRRKRA